jgi:hypothetical protein
MVLAFVARSFPEELGAMRVEFRMNPVMQEKEAHGENGDAGLVGLRISDQGMDEKVTWTSGGLADQKHLPGGIFSRTGASNACTSQHIDGTLADGRSLEANRQPAMPMQQ